MRPSIARMAQGTPGVAPMSIRPDYKAYKSPWGPKYQERLNFNGINLPTAFRLARTAAAFATVGGIFALYFFSDVPRIRKDIMQKIPLLGDHFVREIPPEDNPF